MPKFLITPSLLNSFRYFMDYDADALADKFGGGDYVPKSNDEIRKEFLQTLSRDKFERTEAMQKGIDFEEGIYKHCCLEKETGQELSSCEGGADEIVKIVRGGIWQSVVSKSLHIGSIEYLLYGKTDVMKEDTIYDIKFTTNGSNYDVGKYQNSAQHRIYLYCSGLPKCAYLISDGKNFWREDYVNHDKIEDEIKAMIAEFISYIKSDVEMAQLFYGRWNGK